MAFAGIKRLPTLGDFLVEGGWLSQEQAGWISRILSAAPPERQAL